MKMSEEMAVRLHRMMWSDMKRELGDTNCRDRVNYKKNWLAKHFPGEHFMHDCFLCEYVTQQTGNRPLLGCTDCKMCPIKWPGDDCSLREREGGVYYLQSPISEILALPARNGEKHENDPDVMSLAYCNAKNKLSEASGLEVFFTIEEHIKKIQEKAVEEYFANTPGAKLATMDVDDAFKQYADEQKAPIFHALAEASGLSASNKSVRAHISEIKRLAKISGRGEKCTEIINELSESSGLFIGNWHVSDHIKKIRDDAFSDGENAERERIQEKIEELLS